MAESSPRIASLDRGIEKAIVALKKGTHLLKCGRRGKPKFCPFRLSTDEKFLIWYSGVNEKHLKLNTVLKIVLGQQTVNFLRQPQPEKECQSFSLIYQNGERSLDLICKDKEQAESWFLGLKALVSASRHPRHLGNLRNGRGAQSCASSPAGYIRTKHQGFLKDSVKFSQMHSLYGSPPRSLLERYFSESVVYSSDVFHSSRPRTLSDVQMVWDTVIPNFPRAVSNSFNDIKDSNLIKEQAMTLSSKISSSPHGSPATDKSDVLRDAFMWGEGIGGILGGGADRFDKHGMKFDALLPKLLESTRMLEVLNISCGGKHAALVTKQGEVFCWGEENGGRLGHKIDMDVPYPKVVESLTGIHAQTIACGAHHTCAVTVSGELYAWGDSSHGVELSGDERSKSKWFPHRISGPLDGISISRVACGEWHTAIVSSSGQLFTYGDGTFGVLGHGNLHSVSQPKEVESLKALRVKSVACGPWHTAAVVEIMGGHFKGDTPGGKLFTWGDSDKGRLGHADMERKLLPTCVASLVDRDFLQVSCGRSLTVALTVTGIVFTMGSTVNGQLGNPQAEDKSIAIVEGSLEGEFVKEISSGSFHVAVLTTKGKVYTWGNGANGRLGLGDTKDRNSPALVEALEDRLVQNIACGSSFTAAICLHKSISSKDQSVCSGCRMIFGFTRKKHNCYNCGFFFCHSCSSKKAMNASLAPNKSKQFRVCDSCFTRLAKLTDHRLIASPKQPLMTQKGFSDLKMDRKEKLFTQSQIFSPKVALPENKLIGRTLNKQGNNKHSQDPVLPFLSQTEKWGQVSCPLEFNGHNRENSFVFVPPSKNELSDGSHAHSQQSLVESKSILPTATSLKEGLCEIDKMLTKELQQLQAEARSLSQQCQIKGEKLQQCKQRIEETWSLAKDEAAKCKAAKDVIKVLKKQMNAISEKVSAGDEIISIRSILDDKVNVRTHPLQTELSESEDAKLAFGSNHLSHDVQIFKNRKINLLQDQTIPSSDALTGTNERLKYSNTRRPVDKTHCDPKPLRDEWVEQDELGVYITFMTLPTGQKGLKRVRFSRKRFSEKEAERWWEENQAKVYQKYHIEQIAT